MAGQNPRSYIERSYEGLAAQTSRRHFYEAAGIAGAVFGGGVGSGEVSKGFDVLRKQLEEFVELTTECSIDYDSRIRSSGEKAAASRPRPMMNELDRTPAVPRPTVRANPRRVIDMTSP